MADTTPRDLILAASALVASAALPAAAAEPEGEIMRLFAEWRRIENAFRAGDLSDEDANRMCGESARLCDRMMALRTCTVREFAAKLSPRATMANRPGRRLPR